MDRPILDQVNIVCGDTDESLVFYRRLGIDIPTERVWHTHSGIHHASAAIADAGGGANKRQGTDFDLDSIPFAQKWNTGWDGREDLKGRIVLGFSVESREAVDAIYADLIEAGYAGLQRPFDAFWGARYAIIEDPNGIAVGVMSPVTAAMRSPPPDV